MDALLQYLDNEDSFGSLCVFALVKLYGQEVLDWDFETIWITVQKDGLDLPEEAQQKISAYIALNANPMAIWEVNTFQNTVLASDNIIPVPEITQQAYPVEIGWAIHEIEAFLRHTKKLSEGQSIKWGDDIISYIAAALKADGWIIAPNNLAFVQDALDSINKNTDLKSQILSGTLDTPNTPEVALQLKKLGMYRKYLTQKLAAYNRQVPVFVNSADS